MSAATGLKKHPTKAQFDEIKDALSRAFCPRYFLIDGYLVAAYVVQIKMTLKIAIYVNGFFKGKWLWSGKQCDVAQMPDIVRKFFPLKTANLHSAKQIKAWEKIYGSKARAKVGGVYDKWCSTRSYFSTAGAFIAHIKKHNDVIEILSYDDYRIAIDALGADDE
jgi:hypothetical protein